MRRCMAFLLAVGLLLCATACGDDTARENNPQEETTTTVQTTTTTTVVIVEIPDFIGMDYYAEVENNMDYDHNFNLQIEWENANNPDIAKGQVYAQSPMPGGQVKQGTTVTLYVNSATPAEP